MSGSKLLPGRDKKGSQLDLLLHELNFMSGGEKKGVIHNSPFEYALLIMIQPCTFVKPYPFGIHKENTRITT